MGSSVQASVCYGILLKEGAELPWGDGDIWNWWIDICDFKSTKIVWYVDRHRAEGVTEEDIAIYYQERREFLKTLPAELIRAGTYDQPQVRVCAQRFDSCAIVSLMPY